MPDKKWASISLPLFYFLAFVGFSALWWSPAVVSICTYGSFLFSIPLILKIDNRKIRSLALTLLSIVGIVLVDVLFHIAQTPPWDKLGLIVGFALLYLAAYGSFKQHFLLKNIFFLLLAGLVAGVDMLSLVHYFKRKEEIDLLLLQSKSIPIIPSMHHIHFGVINALFSIGLLFFLVYRKYTSKAQKNVAWVLLVIIYIAAHILSSRTGLLSLYTGLVVGAVAYAYRYGKSVIVAVVLAVLVISTALVYSLSTSFHNKVTNSIEDMNSWGKGAEMNHKSMAMRIEAYRASWYVLKHNPMGVGASRLDEAMAEGFEAIKTPLTPENQKNPHNQLLEYGVKYGWLGMALVLLYFICAYRVFENPVVGAAVISLLVISMSFESLMERQVSIYFIALIVPLYSTFFLKDVVKN